MEKKHVTLMVEAQKMHKLATEMSQKMHIETRRFNVKKSAGHPKKRSGFRERRRSLMM
jgi:hypothetical protein